MITRQVLRKNKLSSTPGPLALLLLAWSSAAIGATGLDTRCDRSVNATDMPEARPASFTMDVGESTNASDMNGMTAPMAAEQPDSLEEVAPEVQSDEAGDPSARLPGVSEYDLLRFKRQMYRKDI